MNKEDREKYRKEIAEGMGVDPSQITFEGEEVGWDSSKSSFPSKAVEDNYNRNLNWMAEFERDERLARERRDGLENRLRIHMRGGQFDIGRDGIRLGAIGGAAVFFNPWGLVAGVLEQGVKWANWETSGKHTANALKREIEEENKKIEEAIRKGQEAIKSIGRIEGEAREKSKADYIEARKREKLKATIKDIGRREGEAREKSKRDYKIERELDKEEIEERKAIEEARGKRQEEGEKQLREKRDEENRIRGDYARQSGSKVGLEKGRQEQIKRNRDRLIREHRDRQIRANDEWLHNQYKKAGKWVGQKAKEWWNKNKRKEPLRLPKPEFDPKQAGKNARDHAIAAGKGIWKATTATGKFIGRKAGEYYNRHQEATKEARKARFEKDYEERLEKVRETKVEKPVGAPYPKRNIKQEIADAKKRWMEETKRLEAELKEQERKLMLEEEASWKKGLKWSRKKDGPIKKPTGAEGMEYDDSWKKVFVSEGMNTVNTLLQYYLNRDLQNRGQDFAGAQAGAARGQDANGYSIRMEDLKKAGINPSMMGISGISPAGGGGGGAAGASPGTQGVSMPSDPMSNALTGAKAENIKADTELKNREAEKGLSEIELMKRQWEKMGSDIQLVMAQTQQAHSSARLYGKQAEAQSIAMRHLESQMLAGIAEMLSNGMVNRQKAGQLAELTKKARKDNSWYTFDKVASTVTQLLSIGVGGYSRIAAASAGAW